MQKIAADRSDHIAKVKFVVTNGACRGSIGMQLCKGGNLKTHLQQTGLPSGYDTRHQRQTYLLAYQLGQAILDMHGTPETLHRIAHHDIKPENILLEDQSTGPSDRLHVTDFGVAEMYLGRTLKNFIGSSRDNLDIKSDYWSKIDAGTMGYRPKNAGLGAEAGPEHDWFSYAAVLWESHNLDMELDVIMGGLSNATRDGRKYRSVAKFLCRPGMWDALCNFCLDVWEQVQESHEAIHGVAWSTASERSDVYKWAVNHIDDFVQGHSFFKTGKALFREKFVRVFRRTSSKRSSK